MSGWGSIKQALCRADSTRRQPARGCCPGRCSCLSGVAHRHRQAPATVSRPRASHWGAERPDPLRRASRLLEPGGGRTAGLTGGSQGSGGPRSPAPHCQASLSARASGQGERLHCCVTIYVCAQTRRGSGSFKQGHFINLSPKCSKIWTETSGHLGQEAATLCLAGMPSQRGAGKGAGGSQVCPWT